MSRKISLGPFNDPLDALTGVRTRGGPICLCVFGVKLCSEREMEYLTIWVVMQKVYDDAGRFQDDDIQYSALTLPILGEDKQRRYLLSNRSLNHKEYTIFILYSL